MNLIQRLFGIKEVTEDDLIKEKNLLMSKVPIEHQISAHNIWNVAYYSYKNKLLKKGKYSFEIESMSEANYELKGYVGMFK